MMNLGERGQYQEEISVGNIYLRKILNYYLIKTYEKDILMQFGFRQYKPKQQNEINKCRVQFFQKITETVIFPVPVQPLCNESIQIEVTFKRESLKLLKWIWCLCPTSSFPICLFRKSQPECVYYRQFKITLISLHILRLDSK